MPTYKILLPPVFTNGQIYSESVQLSEESAQDLIVLGVLGEAIADSVQESSPNLINLNTASAEELGAIEALAKHVNAIIKHRPYESVAEAKPRNLSEETWAEISSKLTV